jgi:hypothetical protein
MSGAEHAARVAISDGEFVVPAEIVAAAFDLDPVAVPDLMREGAITGRTERGEGADAGRHRLTLYHGGRALRLTLGADGEILGRATFPAHPPSPRAG